uniref:Uncharacterized protein n=1 Tax=Daucus carota subsp. sativus TaxID=79200 RepID=A0A165A0I3_DAUCS
MLSLFSALENSALGIVQSSVPPSISISPPVRAQSISIDQGPEGPAHLFGTR